MNANVKISKEAARVLDNVTNAMITGKALDLNADIRTTAGKMASTDKASGTAAIDAGKAIVAAGGMSDANRRTFHIGYIAGRMGWRADAEAKAEAVLDAAGHGRKLSSKQTRARTEAEENAYAASRMAYMRACRAAGLVKAPDAKGDGAGKRGEEKKDGASATVSSPTDTDNGAHEKWDAARLETYIRDQAVAMLQTLNKRSAELDEIFHPELARAVRAFHNAVQVADKLREDAFK